MGTEKYIDADDLKVIITSDKFMNMFVSAKSLYFYLLAFSDSYGIVRNPQMVMRIANAKDCDMVLLLEKKLVYQDVMGRTVLSKAER